MHEAVLKTSCVNIDDNIRKRHVIGLQPQMATFICESCGVQLNKDVVVLTCKMKKKTKSLYQINQHAWNQIQMMR